MSELMEVAYNQLSMFTSGRYPFDLNGLMDFAWNVGASVEYKVAKNMSVKLSYKYFDLGKTVANNKALGIDALNAAKGTGADQTSTATNATLAGLALVYFKAYFSMTLNCAGKYGINDTACKQLCVDLGQEQMVAAIGNTLWID